MTRVVTTPLAPFVDRLPLPSRLRVAERDGRLTVRMRAATHQFHRDLPSSSIWGFEGTVPGPTIEAERGRPVTIEWRNELQAPFPVVDTMAPRPTDANGVPVQCFPGLSGGEPSRHAARLTGNTVPHPHGGLPPAPPPRRGQNPFAPRPPSLLRRLGREPVRPRPARRLPLPDGPARGAPLVPRSRHGHHQARRLCGARRALDRA